jgi:c-di-GMP-binding flagellar brake protein YcgR
MREARRQFERYRCDIEVGVIGNNGEAVISDTFDISEEGIYLMLPVASVVGLMESGSELVSGEKIDILLPNHDQSIDLQISCSIVHAKAVVDGSHLLGVHFLDHDEEVKDHISELISHL